MARQDSPTHLKLRNARTATERLAGLRALKNEIVGHAQLKTEWIALGVLEPIAKTIASPSETPRPTGKERTWTLCEQDQAKLQALQVVASFATEGPSFIAPMLASGVLPALLSNIATQANPPQLVIAALTALLDIVDASQIASYGSTTTADIANATFTQHNLPSLQSIIILPATFPSWETAVGLCSTLIARLAFSPQHQEALTTAGVLDALAMRLSSFAVASGYVVPGADAIARRDGLYKAFPDPAPRTLKMEPILSAIKSVLGWSKYRAHRLVMSPSITAVFPAISMARASPTPDGTRSRSVDSMADVERESDMLIRDQISAMDQLLPLLSIRGVHDQYSGPRRVSARRYPRTTPSRLASSNVWESSQNPGTSEQIPWEHDDSGEKTESPLVAWLICLIRERGDLERLLAASILSSLFQAGLAKRPDREQGIGLLVVPIVISLMSRYQGQKDPSTTAQQQRRRQILEEAPEVLAGLCADREDLQSAAYNSGAIPILTKMLQDAYVPVEPQSEVKWWTPNPVQDDEMEVENDGPTTRMGEAGSDPVMIHQQHMRRISLRALASLGTSEKYRDAMVKKEIFPHVVESLNEYPREPKAAKMKPKDRPFPLEIPRTVDPAYGRNNEDTIIAACHVTRMLSRSVSILRTHIVDYRVAEQILGFMKHSSEDVAAAATAAMCNLVLECSPVRDLLTERNVMQVLCAQAHHVNSPALRLNSLWALKHWVDAVDPHYKQACLAELGAEWLLQMISGDEQDTLVEAGSEKTSEDQPLHWFYVQDGAARSLDASQCTKLRRAEDELQKVLDAEGEQSGRQQKPREEAAAIQEQGLNMIRNLIGRPGPVISGTSDVSDSTEMIDHMLEKFGKQRLFDTLASKFRTRSLGRWTQRGGNSGKDMVLVRPQPRLVEPAIYILVHMAASVPRHRQMVIEQTELLKALVPLATSKDSGVRTALCHLIINLTSVDDDSEADACQQRALVLKELGFQQKLDAMKAKDFDINVRERATTAAWQLGEVAS